MREGGREEGKEGGREGWEEGGRPANSTGLLGLRGDQGEKRGHDGTIIVMIRHRMSWRRHTMHYIAEREEGKGRRWERGEGDQDHHQISLRQRT